MSYPTSSHRVAVWVEFVEEATDLADCGENVCRLWPAANPWADPQYSVTKQDVDSFLSESSRSEFLVSAADRYHRLTTPDSRTFTACP